MIRYNLGHVRACDLLSMQEKIAEAIVHGARRAVGQPLTSPSPTTNVIYSVQLVWVGVHFSAIDVI